MTYVLLLLIVSMPLTDHPSGLDGTDMVPGVVYPHTEDGKRTFVFRTLEDCKDQMVVMARDLHDRMPDMKFVMRCQPNPFYDGESV